MRKKLMRMLTLLLSLLLLVTANSTFVQAEEYWNPIAGTKDWVAMDGNDIDGTATPARVVMGNDGLTITYTGGEYTAGGTNSGVMYALPVDLNNFSVEFTVTKRADFYNTLGTGCDSWISLCLLNQPDLYFNTKKAGQSQGIVTLIRPKETYTSFEVTQLMNDFYGNSLAAYECPGDMKASFKVEIKKGADGVYDYIVNGVTADFTVYGGRDFSLAFTRLMERGDVYFYMGVSSKDSTQQIEWRITKINGVPVKADESEPPVTEPPVTEHPVTEPPVTEPPVTEPPATEPPATEPPVTEPPATEPPATEPPVTEPPVTEPPATEPPVTEPPATEPPATEPTETEPQLKPTESQPVQTAPTDDEAPAGPSFWWIIPVVLVLGGGVAAFIVWKKKHS